MSVRIGASWTPPTFWPDLHYRLSFLAANLSAISRLSANRVPRADQRVTFAVDIIVTRPKKGLIGFASRVVIRFMTCPAASG